MQGHCFGKLGDVLRILTSDHNKARPFESFDNNIVMQV